MKKNLIAVAIAGVLAVPFAAQADIAFSGDARARYNTKTPDGGDAAALTDSRVRLGFVAKDGDVASVHYRGYMSTGTHGDGEPAYATDWAFVKANLGPVTVSAGEMLANWGTKLLYWDVRPKRVMISGKAGGHWMGITFDKSTETNNKDTDVPADGKPNPFTGNDADDKQAIKLLVKGKNYGLLHSMIEDGAGDKSSTVTDVYYMGAAGDIKYNVEFVTEGGDAEGTSLGANMMMPMGGMTLSAALINFADGGAGFDADYLDGMFMGCDAGNVCPSIGDSGDGAMTIAASLGMGFGDGMKGHLSFASVAGDGANEGTGIELAVFKSLSKKTNVKAFFGTVSQDDDSNNTHTGMGAAINTKF